MQVQVQGLALGLAPEQTANQNVLGRAAILFATYLATHSACLLVARLRALLSIKPHVGWFVLHPNALLFALRHIARGDHAHPARPCAALRNAMLNVRIQLYARADAKPHFVNGNANHLATNPSVRSHVTLLDHAVSEVCLLDSMVWVELAGSDLARVGPDPALVGLVALDPYGVGANQAKGVYRACASYRRVLPAWTLQSWELVKGQRRVLSLVRPRVD